MKLMLTFNLSSRKSDFAIYEQHFMYVYSQWLPSITPGGCRSKNCFAPWWKRLLQLRKVPGLRGNMAAAGVWITQIPASEFNHGNVFQWHKERKHLAFTFWWAGRCWDWTEGLAHTTYICYHWATFSHHPELFVVVGVIVTIVLVSRHYTLYTFTENSQATKAKKLGHHEGMLRMTSM